MQRNIQQITQQFVDRLPDNDQYYRLKELHSWGFPSFLVRRMQIELERNMKESLIIPKTDWANTQSDAVQNAWQKFVDAIRAEARLPASYGKTVIETAVADILEMLVQPRKNIPDVIFGQDDELSYDEVRERVESVVIYQHFYKLIPRYMQKKELNQLSKDRCRKIIIKADDKLTSQYSPLNWAQMLEPLFKLVDGEVDTNLLRLFFEDRNKPRVARKFDLMNDSLTRAELIEILSSPELLNFEGYEDDQSKLFEDQPSVDSPEPNSFKKSSAPIEEGEEEQNIEDTGTSAEKSEKTERFEGPENQKNESKSLEEETDNSLNSRFLQGDEQFSEVDDNDKQENSLNAIFKYQNEEGVGGDEIAEELKRLSQKSSSLVDKGSPDKQVEEKQNRTKTDETSDATESNTEKVNTPSSEKETSRENGQDETTGEQEEKPVWMRFMSDEEIEEYESREQEEIREDEEVEEGFIDDPIIDLTEEDASKEEIKVLRNQLSGDRELFVDEIFRGSERAYDEAVKKIAVYNSWRGASKYIEKEIFKRNLVDMYSEAAISFTDQLQSYFLDK